MRGIKEGSPSGLPSLSSHDSFLRREQPELRRLLDRSDRRRRRSGHQRSARRVARSALGSTSGGQQRAERREKNNSTHDQGSPRFGLLRKIATDEISGAEWPNSSRSEWEVAPEEDEKYRGRLFRETMTGRNPVVKRFRHPSKIFPVSMRPRDCSVEQAGIGKILDGHLSLRIGDPELPAIDVALTRLGLDVLPVEFESSAHMAMM